MKIDREIQREVLELLHQAYPNGIQKLHEKVNKTIDEKDMLANLLYLQGHQLISCGYTKSTEPDKAKDERWIEIEDTVITEKGIDFILEDGGLGAILGVITVKLDASTIKALLYRHIEEAKDVTHEQRSLAKKLLSSAGDETLRKLVDSLIEQGLKAAPSTSQLIGMLQGLLA